MSEKYRKISENIGKISENTGKNFGTGETNDTEGERQTPRTGRQVTKIGEARAFLQARGLHNVVILTFDSPIWHRNLAFFLSLCQKELKTEFVFFDKQ